MRFIVGLTIWMFVSLSCFGQEQGCNQLGVWLWHLEGTSYPTMVNLANDLSNLGVKRVYVKVADGGIDTTFWPEIVDETLIQILEDHNLEPWAWSYNYPGNEEAQAQAIYQAAVTGYKGFVIDLESEFDGTALPLLNLVKAFHDSRDSAWVHVQGDVKLPLYVTTWGNPIDHNFNIALMDPFVDGYMPQTYLENWGDTYLEDPTFWIEVGNDEYHQLGATKPIHHIISMEKGNVTAAHVNEFFAASGAESSIWRIPGSGTPLSIRDVWDEVDWYAELCNVTSISHFGASSPYRIWPNPSSGMVTVEVGNSGEGNLRILDCFGKVWFDIQLNSNTVDIDLSSLAEGMYIAMYSTGGKRESKKIIKTQSK